MRAAFRQTAEIHTTCFVQHRKSVSYEVDSSSNTALEFIREEFFLQQFQNHSDLDLQEAMGPLNVQSSRIALRNLKAYGNGKSLFRLSIGQCKGKTDPRRRHKKKSSPAYGENKKKKAKSRLKSMFGHSSGRDHRRTGCSFLALWVQSQSLGISSICLWWYVHLQKY